MTVSELSVLRQQRKKHNTRLTLELHLASSLAVYEASCSRWESFLWETTVLPAGSSLGHSSMFSFPQSHSCFSVVFRKVSTRSLINGSLSNFVSDCLIPDKYQLKRNWRCWSVTSEWTSQSAVCQRSQHLLQVDLPSYGLRNFIWFFSVSN